MANEGTRGRVAAKRKRQRKAQGRPTRQRRYAATFARIKARKERQQYGQASPGLVSRTPRSPSATPSAELTPPLQVAVRDPDYGSFQCPHCNGWCFGNSTRAGVLTCDKQWCRKPFRGVDKAEDAVTPSPAEPDLPVAVLDVVEQVLICPHCQFRMTGVQRARKRKECPDCKKIFKAVRPEAA